jgi:hypothetical protein
MYNGALGGQTKVENRINSNTLSVSSSPRQGLWLLFFLLEEKGKEEEKIAFSIPYSEHD